RWREPGGTHGACDGAGNERIVGGVETGECVGISGPRRGWSLLAKESHGQGMRLIRMQRLTEGSIDSLPPFVREMAAMGGGE
ncbi:MAG: hypothetical protein ABI604_02550, partial [Nitrospirota bacterium]